MHNIDTDTAVGNEFVDGNAEAGVKATRLNAAWFNTIQRELSNIVKKAGMELSQSDDGQVLVALVEYIRRFGIQNILSLFSFTNKNSSLNVGPDGIELRLSDEIVPLNIGFDGIKIVKENLRVEICGDAIRLFSPSGKIELDSNGIRVSSPGGTVAISRSGLDIIDSDGNSVNANCSGVTAKRIASVMNLAAASVKVVDSTKYNLARSYEGVVGDIVLVCSNSASDTAVQFTYNYQETGYKSCVLKPGCALAFYLKTFVKSEIRGIEFAEFVPVSNVTITTNN